MAGAGLIFSDTQLAQFLGQYFWVLTRISAFFLFVPVIGSKLVSPRIRMGLAVMITIIIVPVLPQTSLTLVPSLSIQTFLIIAQQILIGVAMAFILQVLMQTCVMAGQLIAMKMGLGFASMNDPANGISVTIIAQYYLMIATLLYLAFNGHHVALEIFIESFAVMPISMNGLPLDSLWQLASLGSWIFRAGLVFALPLLTALLIVNITFGVVARSAPQMNVFALGFPIGMMLGMVLIWYSFSSFLPSFETLQGEAFDKLKLLIGSP